MRNRSQRGSRSIQTSVRVLFFCSRAQSLKDQAKEMYECPQRCSCRLLVQSAPSETIEAPLRRRHGHLAGKWLMLKKGRPGRHVRHGSNRAMRAVRDGGPAVINSEFELSNHVGAIAACFGLCRNAGPALVGWPSTRRLRRAAASLTTPTGSSSDASEQSEAVLAAWKVRPGHES